MSIININIYAIVLRDAVEVTLTRDYKWWVEAMRDVAVAVEQVRRKEEGWRIDAQRARDPSLSFFLCSVYLSLSLTFPLPPSRPPFPTSLPVSNAQTTHSNTQDCLITTYHTKLQRHN